jgi:hypothetical protein
VDRLYDQFLVLLAAMVLEELGLVLEPFLLLDRLFYIHSKKKREPKQGKYVKNSISKSYSSIA